MAEVTIYRIQFLQNNPYGTYVTNDVLEVKVETTQLIPNNDFNTVFSVGVKVYKNGIQVFSGPQILPVAGYVSAQFFNPQICVVISIFSYGLFTPASRIYQQFPYLSYVTVPSELCGLSPVTCDLIVVGSPDVIPASNNTASDGSITLTTQSTFSVQYNIGSDFVYGFGQTSPTFTGLSKGFYRIYIRDLINCSANVYVEVPSVDSYGLKYYLTYFETMTGFETKIEILEREYLGLSTEYKAGDSPIILRMRGEGQDKFTSVLPIQADLTLISETQQEYINLYTNDPDKYRVKYYKDTGSGFNLKFIGRLLPFLYQEDYAYHPYQINVTASDGLADLKDFAYLQKDGLNFQGRIKLIKIIAYCLSYTKLDLNIRVAINMYASGMNTTSSDDPLDQAYLDAENFYLKKDTANISDILFEILKPFGARLVQWDGYWNIVRVEEMFGSYDYREFDKSGDYVSNGSFNPVLDVDYPEGNGDVLFTGIPNLELQAGYGRVKVTYDLGLDDNILKNGDFQLVSKYETSTDTYIPALNNQGWSLVNAGYILNEGYEVIEGSNIAYAFYNPLLTVQGLGNAYIMSDTYNVKMGAGNTLKISLRCKVDAPSQFPPRYIAIRMMVEYGGLYLLGDRTWSAFENTFSFFAEKLNEYDTYEITASQPNTGTPLNGMDLKVRVYHAHAYHSDFNSLVTLKAFDTIDLSDNYRITYKDPLASSSSGDYVYYYELIQNTEPENGLILLQPDDYGAGNGNRKWVLVDYLSINEPQANFAIDFVKIQFQYNGIDPLKEIVRTATAEDRNKLELDETVIIGSSAQTVATEGNVYFEYPALLYGEKPRVNILRTNVLSYDLVYKGWLSNSNATTAWDNWTRDGVAESELLHNIFLKSNVAQYKRSWRLLRGSMVSTVSLIGMLNSFREVNDSNRLYIPVSLSLDDRFNTVSFEILELIPTSGGSDGSGAGSYSSGFTTGFGPDFN